MKVAAVGKVMRRLDVDLDFGGGRGPSRLKERLLLLAFDEQAHVGINPMLELHFPHCHELFALHSEILLPLMEQPVVLAVP